MKMARFAVAIAFFATICLRQAPAQQEVPSPSDVSAQAAADASVVVKEDTGKSSKDDGFGGKGCSGCGSGLGSSLACMCGGEPWSLWSALAPCAAANSSVSAGGWAQLGYHTEGTNGDGTGMFNNYPNRVQTQQAWLWLEKSIDADRYNAWDWGFRMDYVHGTDGPDTQAFGGRPLDWDNNWNSGNFYGSAIPQLYVELAYNDLSVKMGHFYTICGYEVVQAPHNFFYSHAFTMYFAEPFTHTGALAEYAWSDNVTLWGGYTTGWDTGFSRNFGDTFLGGFSLQLLDNVKASYTTTAGNFGFGAGGSDQTGYSHSIVVDVAVTERLNYVFQSDYLDNELLMPGVGIDKAWGFNNYLLYAINDCVGVGGRLEYFDDERFGGDVTALTLGMNIRPTANMILRPEVRWEDFDPAVGRRDSTILGMDMILTF